MNDAIQTPIPDDAPLLAKTVWGIVKDRSKPTWTHETDKKSGSVYFYFYGDWDPSQYQFGITKQGWIIYPDGYSDPKYPGVFERWDIIREAVSKI